MCDVVIVGAGLFGQVIWRACRANGMNAVMIDRKEPLAGSAPSGSLMKPSWFAGMGKAVYDPALRTLNAVCEVDSISFRAGKVANTNVFRLRLPGVDTQNAVIDNVTEVGSGYVRTAGGAEYWPAWTVIAAGVWSTELAPVPKLKGKQGISFWYPGQVAVPFIEPWAPYKQVVAYNYSDSWIWAGDGTAILPENWTEERARKSIHRVADHLGRDPDTARYKQGIRPYVPGAKPAYLQETKTGVWVATGGAKNGAIGAGWVAWKLLKEVFV